MCVSIKTPTSKRDWVTVIMQSIWGMEEILGEVTFVFDIQIQISNTFVFEILGEVTNT